MYKLAKDMYGNQNGAIRDNGNGSFTWFAFDETVSEYKAYLAWVEQGNVAQPADEVTA